MILLAKLEGMRWMTVYAEAVALCAYLIVTPLALFALMAVDGGLRKRKAKRDEEDQG